MRAAVRLILSVILCALGIWLAMPGESEFCVLVIKAFVLAGNGPQALGLVGNGICVFRSMGVGAFFLGVVTLFLQLRKSE